MRRRSLLGLIGSPLIMAAADSSEAEGQEPGGQAVGVVNDPRTSCLNATEHMEKFALAVTDVLLNDLKEGRGDAEACWRLHRHVREIPEFCSLVVAAIIRSSPFRRQACMTCSDVCDRCAVLADATPFDHNKDFAEQLRDCAASCRAAAQVL